MRWELSEEQEMFQDSLRAWLDRFVSSQVVRGWLDAGDPGPFERRLASEGWLAVGLPEELGGEGGGLLELALMAERFGHCAVPSSAWMASVLAAPALAGSPDVAAGGGAFAALAVDADKPVDASRPIEIKGNALIGVVRSVLGADRARWLVVPVRTAAGRELFLVDVNAAGVGISGRKLLDRSRTIADVTFDEVEATRLEVDAERVLTLASLRAAVLVAADSLGAAERMLELAVEYSKQRRQFGVPIGSFQAVKHAAAQMLVAVEASRSIVYYAAASVEQGHEEAELHAAVAKAQVATAGEEVADSSLTLHGAVGYTWEHDLQLFYKRAKLNKCLFGSPRTWNERISSALPLVPVG